MSKNPLILSYNKNLEIEEFDPASSPSISSSDSNDKNDLMYHSYFILPSMSLKEKSSIQNIKTNNTLFKSFSGSPLIFNNDNKNNKKNINKNNIYNTKTQKLSWKKEINNNNIKINKINKTEKKSKKKIIKFK